MPNVRELVDMLRVELAGGQAAEGAASSPCKDHDHGILTSVQAVILSKFLALYSDNILLTASEMHKWEVYEECPAKMQTEWWQRLACQTADRM